MSSEIKVGLVLLYNSFARNNSELSLEKLRKIYKIVNYEAIELASTPDWYYPSKGEYPKDCEVVYCVYGDNNCTCEVEYNEDDSCFYEVDSTMRRNNSTIVEIKAWTHLPKFEN